MEGHDGEAMDLDFIDLVSPTHQHTTCSSTEAASQVGNYELLRNVENDDATRDYLLVANQKNALKDFFEEVSSNCFFISDKI